MRGLAAAAILSFLAGCGETTAGAPKVSSVKDAAPNPDAAADAGLSDRPISGPDVRISDAAPDSRSPDGPLDGAPTVLDAHKPDAAGPDAQPADAAVKPPAAPGPIWLVQISDTHVGETPATGANLTAYLDQVLPVIAPVATLHTGDLIDDGGEAVQWAEYDTVTTGHTPAYPEYLEIPGNHDVKHDGLMSYELHAHTFQAGDGLFGETDLDTPAGTIRLIRTNTADTTLNAVNVLGYFGDQQMNALLAAPEPAEPPLFTLVLGHHPIGGVDGLFLLDSNTRMQRVFDRFQPAAYLCGHIHIPFQAWVGGTLQLQAGSLGKENLGSPSFMVIGYDAGQLTARSVNLDGAATPPVQWPLTLVTAPPDAALGGVNPKASAVAPGALVAVHALVFGPDGPDALPPVEARFDHGQSVRLAPQGGPVWMGEIAAPIAAGAHTLSVGPQGAGPHTVTVQVSAQ